jgi:hypothetical protein
MSNITGLILVLILILFHSIMDQPDIPLNRIFRYRDAGFPSIITLNSGETCRVIIPECIRIPPDLSNTYLLADTAFLLAGHTYESHLSKPKLKFQGGGQYTMSVTKGHKLIRILPTPANQDTPHRKIYFHIDEPYDPPTFANHVFYQCSNRPNAHTPPAFTWHLRCGAYPGSVLL